VSVSTDRLELEQIGREVIVMLHTQLNDRIEDQAMFWGSRDEDFAQRMGTDNPGVVVESIPTDNFYVGSVPSLIEAPVDKYPNCAAYAYSASPQLSDDDNADIYEVRVAVEIMCKSVTDEQEVNSRVNRTLEAAHSVFRTEGARELSGYIVGKVSATPIITVGDVFVRREQKSRGPRWFWQGGRLEYRLERYVQYG
jgi:hypothetical protein